MCNAARRAAAPSEGGACRAVVPNEGGSIAQPLKRMDFRTHEVLISGGLGWLGSRLVEALIGGLPEHDGLKEPRSDLRLRCLVLAGQDVSALRKLSDRIEVITGDLHHPGDCERLFEGGRDAVLFEVAGGLR